MKILIFALVLCVFTEGYVPDKNIPTCYCRQDAPINVVCGVTGKTYKNYCELICADDDKWHDGPCSSKDMPKGQKPRPLWFPLPLRKTD